MKKKIIGAGIGILILFVLFFSNMETSRENQFSAATKLLADGDKLLVVDEQIQLSKTHDTAFKLVVPMDFTLWEDLGESYLYKEPGFETNESHLNKGVVYVNYNKKDELYYVVANFVVWKKNTGYDVDCVLLVEADNLNVRVDRMNIKERNRDHPILQRSLFHTSFNLNYATSVLAA